MCAIGSLYTGGLFPTGNISDSYPCESLLRGHIDAADRLTVDIMTGERRKGKQRITSFGEQQAKYAKQAVEEGLDLGENLFECTQGKLVIRGKRRQLTFA